jgi:hypothetical protein
MKYKGFVVGYDHVDEGAVIWKVRVKDRSCALDGVKLIVASTKNDVKLARGANVTFLIGSVDGLRGSKSPRAFDVELD